MVITELPSDCWTINEKQACINSSADCQYIGDLYIGNPTEPDDPRKNLSYYNGVNCIPTSFYSFNIGTNCEPGARCFVGPSINETFIGSSIMGISGRPGFPDHEHIHTGYTPPIVELQNIIMQCVYNLGNCNSQFSEMCHEKLGHLDGFKNAIACDGNIYKRR